MCAFFLFFFFIAHYCTYCSLRINVELFPNFLHSSYTCTSTILFVRVCARTVTTCRSYAPTCCTTLFRTCSNVHCRFTHFSVFASSSWYVRISGIYIYVKKNTLIYIYIYVYTYSFRYGLSRDLCSPPCVCVTRQGGTSTGNFLT